MRMSGPGPLGPPRGDPPPNLAPFAPRHAGTPMFPFGKDRDGLGRSGLARYLSPAFLFKANVELPATTVGGGLLIVLQGIVARYALSREGRRRIVGMLAVGDVCCDRAFSDQDTDGFVSLTDCVVACLPFAEAYGLVQDFPSVGRAIWRITARSTGIYAEWLRTQSLPGENRLAHRMCEVLVRSPCARMPSGVLVPRFRLDDWADMTALTSVHVSRCLTAMSGAGLIALERRSIMVPDPAVLAAYAEFDPAYLWPNAPLPADELGRAIVRGRKPDLRTQFD